MLNSFEKSIKINYDNIILRHVLVWQPSFWIWREFAYHSSSLRHSLLGFVVVETAVLIWLRLQEHTGTYRYYYHICTSLRNCFKMDSIKSHFLRWNSSQMPTIHRPYWMKNFQNVHSISLQLTSKYRITSPSHESPESRVPSPESRVPSPESRVPSPESRVPSPESRVPSPESRVPSPESRVPSPESRVPSPWQRQRRKDHRSRDPLSI